MFLMLTLETTTLLFRTFIGWFIDLEETGTIKHTLSRASRFWQSRHDKGKSNGRKVLYTPTKKSETKTTNIPAFLVPTCFTVLSSISRHTGTREIIQQILACSSILTDNTTAFVYLRCKERTSSFSFFAIIFHVFVAKITFCNMTSFMFFILQKEGWVGRF